MKKDHYGRPEVQEGRLAYLPVSQKATEGKVNWKEFFTKMRTGFRELIRNTEALREEQE